MASSAADIQAVLITLMTPAGPLYHCWMMPEDTLQRWENKAREQPESETALLAGKKIVLWEVCGVNRPGTFLFACLFSHPAFRECLYLGITLDSRINAKSLLSSVCLFYIYTYI